MRKKKSSGILPIPVTRALRKLGHDIRDARRRRRIPAEITAQRASISRTTLVKIEKGDPGVAIGSYAIVLFVMGMTDRLADAPSAALALVPTGQVLSLRWHQTLAYRPPYETVRGRASGLVRERTGSDVPAKLGCIQRWHPPCFCAHVPTGARPDGGRLQDPHTQKHPSPSLPSRFTCVAA